MSKEFEVRREIVVPASPDEVWEAVATRAGNAAWLFPNDIDPAGEATKAWDPPNHFAVRTERGEWFNAVEYTIEAREGGKALVRYVHSGIFLEDWDNQYDGVRQHTDFYLHTLGAYLQYFRGRTATYIGDVPRGIDGPASSAAPDGFARLQQALGIGPELGEGDGVRLTPKGLDPISGVIDYRRGNFLELRSDDAIYCFFGRNAFGAPVAVSIHSFAPGVDAESTKRRWAQWLATTLA